MFTLVSHVTVSTPAWADCTITSGGGSLTSVSAGSQITCSALPPNTTGILGAADNVKVDVGANGSIVVQDNVTGGGPPVSTAIELGNGAQITVAGDIVSSGKTSTGIRTGNDLSLLILSGGEVRADAIGNPPASAFAVQTGDRANITVGGDIVTSGKGTAIDAGQDLTLLVLSGGRVSGYGTGISVGDRADVTVGGTIEASSETGTAINFYESNNRLTLLPGYSIIGNVVGFDTTNTLRLGGTGQGTFDASQLGTQYSNFSTFQKVGSSTWTLTGTNPAAAPIDVLEGRLVADATIENAAFTVADGATLSGIGTLGAITAENGAIIAPGSGGIGTLTVNGNVTFAAGSIYQVKANPTQADRITASGTATLNGGTVQVLAENGNYQPSTTYTILSADGGVIGTFTNVSSNLAFLTPSLGYDAKAVNLTLVRKTEPQPPTPPTPPAPQPVAFHSVAVTGNQYAVADAVEALGTGNHLFDAVIGQSVPGARQAFDALSGEAHASAATTAFSSAGHVQNAVLSRLRGSPIPAFAQIEGTYAAAYAADRPGVARQPAAIPVQTFDPRRFALWGEGFGSWGKVDGSANAARLDTSTGGFILGADAQVADAFRVGFAAGFTRTTFDVDGRLSSGSNETVFGALYGSGSWGNVTLRVGASYAGHDIDTRRQVQFPGFSDQVSASYDGWTAQAFGEIGYRVDLAAAQVEPFVGASVLRLHTNAFREEGGPAALAGYAQDQDLATTTLGVRAEARLSDTVPLIARGLLGWRHAYGDVAPEALLAFSGGASAFTVAGTPIDRNALVAEAGLDWQITPAVTLGAAYVGQIGSQAQEHALKGNFIWKF
ncbi:autotransporter domain-containing protein [Microvirga sp. TS319]|uniref:autotransporter family protein n=1 Tax=Microvirga sp. TS319 TaxID=3241165 RepID=UPI00351A05AC